MAKKRIFTKGENVFGVNHKKPLKSFPNQIKQETALLYDKFDKGAVPKPSITTSDFKKYKKAHNQALRHLEQFAHFALMATGY